MGGPREAQETPRGGPGAHGSDPGSAQGGPQKAQERPRSGPRAPEVPRRAQNGSLDVKTNRFYKVFASPDLKNDGLAKVFEQSVAKPKFGKGRGAQTTSFTGVSPPRAHKTHPTTGDARREDKRRQDKGREGKM